MNTTQTSDEYAAVTMQEELTEPELTAPIPINPLQPGEEREDIQEMATAAEALMFVSAESLALADLRRVLAVRQPTLERILTSSAKPSPKASAAYASNASTIRFACQRARNCPLI